MTRLDSLKNRLEKLSLKDPVLLVPFLAAVATTQYTKGEEGVRFNGVAVRRM